MMSGLAVGCVALTATSSGTAAATAAPSPALFAQDNLLAWCIVPFDSLKRGPAERVAMLKRLGFSQYAWDWRDEHLADFPAELRLARENGIRLRAVWLWIERDKDVVGRLYDGNRIVMAAVKEAGIAVDFWVGFHDNFFEGLDETARVQQGAAMMAYLAREAAGSNSTVSLYNHGGWVGEAENQVAIIRAAGEARIGIVYNFHHAHHEIDKFAENLARVQPYLRTVNLNGMKPGGPKILPIGAGSHEAAMLKLLVASGYRGPIGVLGHVDADVEQVLARNLQGLRELVTQHGWPH